MSKKRQKFILNFLQNIYEKANGRKNTQSIRKSQQCVANTLKDKQCRKRTAHTEKCWVHLAKQNNLRIKPSHLIGAGKGLYTWKRTIPRGSTIGKYTGRRQITLLMLHHDLQMMPVKRHFKTIPK